MPLRRAFGGVGQSFGRGKRYYLRMMGRGRDDWSVGWVHWRFGEVFFTFFMEVFSFFFHFFDVSIIYLCFFKFSLSSFIKFFFSLV